MNSIILEKQNTLRGTVLNLPSSKSISNRVLILDALSGRDSRLSNISTANDTVLMGQLLSSTEQLINAEDAGTVMRFLTAYYAITNQHKIITGTARMKERPIGVLTEALCTIGAEIYHVEKDGYPPLQISGLNQQRVKNLRIRGDVSSQFISALMMIAPLLPLGLTLELTGTVGSRPYIEMTAALMRAFGASIVVENNTINIASKKLLPTTITIENDWSAASYWFAFVALAQQAEVELPNMTLRSLQGDRVIVSIMENLGVGCEPRGNNLLLIKKEHQATYKYDFSNCPDLAQTVAVVCAAKGIDAEFTGLESLRIKETDRIAALQNELAKIGAYLEEQTGVWRLVPSHQLPLSAHITTYHDHRMAMAFAPLSMCMNIIIDDPEVTKKSYPLFWNDVKLLRIS